MGSSNHRRGAPLDGAGVLVTRPRGQAERLCRMVRDAGGEPIHYPSMSLSALPVDRLLAGRIDRLESYRLAIFISANAVDQGLAAVRGRRAWPDGLQVAAVGKATAAALARNGLRVHLIPRERFDSEGLLELDELQQVAGQRILVFRGVGGRETLAETLRARGAEVDYAETYTRSPPPDDPEPLLRRMAAGEVELGIVSSGEGYANLVTRFGAVGAERLHRLPLVVASARILEVAGGLGWHGRSVVAREASDGGLFDAVLALHAKLKQESGKHE